MIDSASGLGGSASSKSISSSTGRAIVSGVISVSKDLGNGPPISSCCRSVDSATGLGGRTSSKSGSSLAGSTIFSGVTSLSSTFLGDLETGFSIGSSSDFGSTKGVCGKAFNK